jgi:hypothetical protein
MRSGFRSQGSIWQTPADLLQLSGKTSLELLPDVKEKLHYRIPQERKGALRKVLQAMFHHWLLPDGMRMDGR